MLKYILKRLFYAFLTVLGVATVVFLLQHLSGDPITLILPPEASTPQEIARLRMVMGLDKPLYVQYGVFLSGLLHGDLGYSYRQGAPALTLALSRVPATFQLAFSGMLVACTIGITAGIVAATKRDTIIDRIVMSAALIGQAMPVFWTGILLIIVFSVKLKWLPAIGNGGFQSLIMPALAIGGYSAARIGRMTRSSMLEVLGMDYIRTARGKGLREKSVILKHCFRNTLIPIVTVLGLEFAGLMGGTVITESVFAWPGVGRLAVAAVLGRDYPVVQAVVLIVSTIFVLINLGVDLLYGYLDPRISVSGSSK